MILILKRLNFGAKGVLLLITLLGLTSSLCLGKAVEDKPDELSTIAGSENSPDRQLGDAQTEPSAQLASASSTEITTDGQIMHVRSGYRLPKILNFKEFGKKFGKHYKSIAEKVEHKKNFIAKVIRISVSAIRYKYRRQNYALGFNHMSDYGPSELATLSNRRMAEMFDKDNNAPPVANENVSNRLGQHQKQRRRRDTSAVSGPVGYEPVVMWYVHPLGSEPETGGQQAVPWSMGVQSRAEDTVYFDLRQTNTQCIFSPRNQGKCASCYAFAFIFLLEWFNCMATGEKIAFSEQYLIDCGKLMPGRMGEGGCKGGNFEDASNFVNNFGVEVLSHYPFRESEGQCPYSSFGDIQDHNHLPQHQTMGAIRMNMKVTAAVPLIYWHNFLPNGPMWVGIRTDSSFVDYDRGVHEPRDCAHGDYHAVALVGHGREDGLDYWLFRNSFSLDWGEQGYYKLAKRASGDCIVNQVGYMIGTQDGQKYQFKPELNTLNNAAGVRALYSGELRKSMGIGSRR